MQAGSWLKIKIHRRVLTIISSAKLSNNQTSRVTRSNFRKILMMLFLRILTERLKNCENYQDLKPLRRMEFWTLKIWLLLKKTIQEHILKKGAINTICLVSVEPIIVEWPSLKLSQMTLQSPVTLTEATFPTMWSKSWKEREIWTKNKPSVRSWILPPFGINKESKSQIKLDRTITEVPHKSECKKGDRTESWRLVTSLNRNLFDPGRTWVCL